VILTESVDDFVIGQVRFPLTQKPWGLDSGQTLGTGIVYR